MPYLDVSPEQSDPPSKKLLDSKGVTNADVNFLGFFFLSLSFGVIPSTPLAIHTPLMPNQSIDVSLPLNTLGPVMKMEPLNNLQVSFFTAFDIQMDILANFLSCLFI